MNQVKQLEKEIATFFERYWDGLYTIGDLKSQIVLAAAKLDESPDAE